MSIAQKSCPRATPVFIGVPEDIAAKTNGVKNVYNATDVIPLAAVITASTTHKKNR